MHRECKGADICPHDKIKYNCRHCAPPGHFCIHDRYKTRCKECKGGSICSHNRIRSSCKECKGGGICAHGNYKTSCKLCGGGSICEHNRVRSKCKDCGGSQICKHGRERCVRAPQFNSHGIPSTRRSPQVQLQAVQGQGILRSRQKTHRTVQGLLRTVRKNAGSGGYRRSKGTLQTQDSTDCHCSKGAPCA
jgi:hypothetical protein